MRKLITISLVLFTVCLNGQVLTLDNLLYLYNKKFTTANDYILNKKFDFIKSEGYYNKQVMYAKNYENGYREAKATEWLNVYTDIENNVYSVAYQHTSKSDFNIFRNALTAKGFKQKETTIDDNKLVTVYSNKSNNITTSVNANDEGLNSYIINIEKYISPANMMKAKLDSIAKADSTRKADSTAVAMASSETSLDYQFDEALDFIIKRDNEKHNYYYIMNRFDIAVYNIVDDVETETRDSYFGNLSKGYIKEFNFRILNRGINDIELTGFKCIDNAVQVKFEKRRLKQYESANIYITLNTRLAVSDIYTDIYANEINISSTIGEIPLIIYGYINKP